MLKTLTVGTLENMYGMPEAPDGIRGVEGVGFSSDGAREADGHDETIKEGAREIVGDVDGTAEADGA